jgi:hypothetical protein
MCPPAAGLTGATRTELWLASKLGKEVASAVERNRDDMVGERAYSLATPALALCSSERAYFITWERSECPISSASSLT